MAKIDDYKDRMTSPVGAVRIDPETREPIGKTVHPTYVEPESYFNEDMKKAAEEWDRKHANDITYSEALEIAKKHRPEVDTCTEQEDMFVFSYSKDVPADGWPQPIVVMKDDGRAMPFVTYWQLKNGRPLPPELFQDEPMVESCGGIMPHMKSKEEFQRLKELKEE